MNISKAEPRFDLDLRYGKEGELRIQEFLDWVINESSRLEVKRKRILDEYIYVETHCDYGRRGEFAPSGISVTTAQVWAVVLGQSQIHIAIPTRTLKWFLALDDPSTRDKGEAHGDCPTRGKLIDFTVLLHRLDQKRRQRDNVVQFPQDTAQSAAPVAGEIDSTAINWGMR